MGGYGSSRWGWYSKKTTVEDCRVIAAPDLIAGPARGYVHWSSGGQVKSSIGYEVQKDDNGQPARVVLDYRLLRSGENINYPVSLTRTFTSWGSSKYWFICPAYRNGQACGRRVKKLYLPPGGRYFACRHCYNLTYQSCQESKTPTGLLLGILTPEILEHYPGMTPAEIMRVLDCELTGRKPPPALRAKLRDSAMTWAIEHIRAELASMPDPYAGYLTAGELCERAGLRAEDLARLESARLLVPDREGKYRPKLAGWAGKLAYLLRNGWELPEIASWSRGRWSTPDPRRWPPDRADWLGES